MAHFPCPARVQSFLRDENGAVTVDWVVLTAGVVGLALATIGLIRPLYAPGADNIGTTLGSITIDTQLDAR